MLWFLFLAGCIATPSDHPVDVFEGVWGDFDRLYGGFEARGVDWDAEYDEWRPAVDDGSSEDELWDALTGLLTTLDDGHVRLLAPDRDMFESNHVYRDREMEGTFDDQVVRTYLTDIDTGPWDWYLRGTVAPRVAYVWFPGIDDNTYVIDTIVDGGPDALIIDLRHSHGGATTYAMHGTGRLTEQDQVTCSTRSRNGPGRRDFDEWFAWTTPARTPYWGGDLYVLVDAETISASERVLMFLMQLPNATTIGVTSNGAQATSIGIQAPNGWGVQLPVQEIIAGDGEMYEPHGIPVDIEMLNDPEDVAAGTDEVLEYAIGLATGTATR